jgi:anti-sigma B factor antagonist
MPIDSKRVDPGVAVIALSGRLVFGRDTEQLEQIVRKFLAAGDRRFVLDATALEYVDSAGIGALVSSLTSVRQSGGDLRLAGAGPRIVRLFALTGIDKLLSVYPTVSEAAAAN